MRSAILILAAFFVASLVSPVEATFKKQPLIYIVKNSQLIVDATIVGSESVRLAGSMGSCGTIYRAEVSEVLSGKHQQIVTFASTEQFTSGKRYLLFLKDADDFPSDIIVERSADEEKRYRECLKRLPGLKSDGLFTAPFVGYGQRYVSLSYLTITPPDLKVAHVRVKSVEVDGEEFPLPGAVELFEASNVMSRNVVEWEQLRLWILDRLSKIARP